MLCKHASQTDNTVKTAQMFILLYILPGSRHKESSVECALHQNFQDTFILGINIHLKLTVTGDTFEILCLRKVSDLSHGCLHSHT